MSTITTGNGSDSITGTSSSDVISSGNGDDSVNGGAGSDSIDGGNGNDTLDGGSGDDTVYGGNGDDLFIYNVTENIDLNNTTYDYYDGNRGFDTIKLIVTQQQALDLAAAIDAFNASNKSTVFDFQQYVSYVDLRVINIEHLIIEIIDSPNHNPIAIADVNSIAEDATPVIGNVLLNDSDSDLGDVLAVTQVQFGASTVAVGSPLAGVYGSLVLNANGSYTYTLNNASTAVQALAVGESHNEVFTYTISDGNGGTASATLTITVTGTNDAPVAQSSIVAVNEGAPILNGNVIATDVDHVAMLSFALVNPAPAGLIFNPDGSYSFDPNNLAYNNLAQDELQTLNIQFVATDEHGAQSNGLLTINITGTNDAPVAQSSVMAVNEGAPILNGNVIATDVDHGAMLSFALVNPAPAGLIFNPDGSYSFDPNNLAYNNLAQDELQTLNIQFVATDELGAQSNGLLTINITGTNDAPVAQSSVMAVNEGAPILNGNVIATDVDQGAVLNFALVNPAPAGLIFNPDGSYSFDPNNPAYDHLAQDELQTLNIQFVATDEHGAQSNGLLTINITGTNDAPVAQHDYLMIDDTVNAAPALLPVNLLANDTDDAPGFHVTNANLISATVSDHQIFGVYFNLNDLAVNKLAVPNPGMVASFQVVITGLSANAGVTEYAMIDIAADGSVSIVKNAAFDALPSGINLQLLFSYQIQDAGGLTSNALFQLDITGTDNNDVILGTNLNDTLNGGLLDDMVYGFSGDDNLNGNSGNDTLVGSFGNDTLDGSTGIDKALYSHDVLSTDARNFIQGTGSASATADAAMTLQYNLFLTTGFANIQDLTGSDGNDKIVTDTTINYGSSVELINFNSQLYNLVTGQINAGTLDVAISGNTTQSDLIIGGVGRNYEIVGDIRVNTGTLAASGNDIILGETSTATRIYEIAGDAYSNSGTITTAGNDVIVGGTNVVGGGSYEIAGDVYFRNTGFIGVAGNDIIIGGANNDGEYRLYGDVYVNSSSINIAGNDVILGGANLGSGLYYLIGDVDRIDSGAVLSKAGDDIIKGGSGNDILIGDVRANFGTITTAGNDKLDGGAGNDTLYGDVQLNSGTVTNWGDDELSGGSGNDQLFGQAGNDTLAGGADNDTLDGGTGIDTAKYFADILGTSARAFINGALNGSAVLASFKLGTLMNYNLSLGTVGTLSGIKVEGINAGAIDGNDLILAALATYNSSTVERIDFMGTAYNLINGIDFPSGTLSGVGTAGDDLLVGGGASTFGSYQIYGDVIDNLVSIASGNDVIIGRNSVTPYLLYGDAGSNSATLTAGDDVVIGADENGTGSYRVHGDVSVNNSGATLIGGNDIIIGHNNNSTGTYSIIGDAFVNSGTMTGGNDVLIGGDNNSTGLYFLYGDVQSNLGTITLNGNDVLSGGANNSSSQYYLIGDVYSNSGTDSTTGSDDINGGANTSSGTYYMVGDIYTDSSSITILSTGNDTLTGGDNTSTGTYELVGDVMNNSGIITQAGDDILTGGAMNNSQGVYYLVGDVFTNSRTLSHAGDDTLIAGPNNTGDIVNGGYYIVGDVFTNSGTAPILSTGDDNLIAHMNNTGFNFMVGDVFGNNTSITATGNDSIMGSAGVDVIVGDVQNNSGTLTYAGNDVLNGGKGDDNLTGDVSFGNQAVNRGTNTFVFDVSGSGDGHDIIRDFNSSNDILEFHNVTDLATFEANSQVVDAGDGRISLVYAGGASSIYFVGVFFQAGHTEISDYAAHINIVA